MSCPLRAKENIWQENLAWCENWHDKYIFIIEQGKLMPGIPEAERSDSMLVKGCQSQVWLKVTKTNAIIEIQAESDALIVRGLIAMIVDIYSGFSVAAIQAYDHGFAERLGLTAHLSPARANGLHAILAAIQAELN